MAKKVLLGGLSAVLLVAVVVGIVAGVTRSNHKVGDNFSLPSSGGDDSVGLSTTSKAISALCAPTDYRDVCVQTLSKASNGTNSTKALVEVAVKAIIDEVSASFGKPAELGKGVSDKMNKAALEGCSELLGLAANELQAVAARTGEPKEMSQHVDDINTWLSAVITYGQTCLDELTLPELKSAMEGGIRNATMLTSNAIAIINAVTKFVNALPIQNLNLPDSRRRLLSASDMTPTWLSAGDRKLLASNGGRRLQPNAVVAQDGTGNFRTISDAVAAIPKNFHGGRYVIYVKAGVYKEYVVIQKEHVNVFMYGDGPRKTIVTGNKNNIDGVPTSKTATFTVYGKGFICKGMGFSNTAGAAKHQAVALRVLGDMSAFFNCRMDAFQDTLYVHAQRQFYRNCVISGTVDFIFGDSRTIIQNSLLIVRRPMDNQQCIVTAQGRIDPQEVTGIVIHNCRIVPDRQLFPDRFKIRSYLGRPWKPYSTAVFLENTIGDLIQPDGYMPWDGTLGLDTLYYAEYGNRGPGAATNRRVRWRGVHILKSRAEAMKWTVGPFIQGDQWLKYTGAPFLLGLKN